MVIPLFVCAFPSLVSLTRLTDKHLSSLIKVGAAQAFQPDIQKLLAERHAKHQEKMLKKVFHFVFVKSFHYFMFMNATKHSNDVPNFSVIILYNRCYSFYYILSTPLMVMCTWGPHGNMHMTHVALKVHWVWHAWARWLNVSVIEPEESYLHC